MSSEKRTLKNRINKTGSPDKVLVFIICALVIFGIMAVLSASAPEGADVYGNSLFFLTKHLIAVAIGTVALIIAYKIDFHNWQKIVIPISYVVLVLLMATLIPGLGKTNYGSSRWLDIGITLQPSEFCKFAAILLVSSAIVESKSILDSKMMQNVGLVLFMILIVFLQPNLSGVIILSLITVTLLLIGGFPFRFIGFASIAAGLAVGWKFMQPYQLARIKSWLDPWSDPQGAGYNMVQSLYAIGSGGILGVGYGNSRQKLFWLPFSHTDFIFAIIAEELGLIGCLILIGLFIALFLRGFRIAKRCPDSFGKFVAIGITFTIAIQAFINIGVATGVLPVTGITLPLISYGGTSIVLTMFMLGVLLNISKKRAEQA